MAESKIEKDTTIVHLWNYTGVLQNNAWFANASDYDAVILTTFRDTSTLKDGFGIWATYYMVKTQSAWYSDGTHFGKVEYDANGDLRYYTNSAGWFHPLNLYGVKLK